MIRLITFTDDNMTIAANKLVKSAKLFGADQALIYNPADFADDLFKDFIEPLIKDSRGFGWWMWKPWIIMNELRNLNEGDILIYSDAGQEIVGDLRNIINAMDQDIMFFTNGFQHSHWCKSEVATRIHGEVTFPDYGSHKQVQASFIFFRVNEATKNFIQEWYAYSIMPGMIDNTPRGPQFPEFAEHRHDQAILTCLQIKYGYKLHWFPSTTNFHQQTQEKYGVTVLHHRKRNNEW